MPGKRMRGGAKMSHRGRGGIYRFVHTAACRVPLLPLIACRVPLLPLMVDSCAGVCLAVGFSFIPYVDWAAHLFGLVGGALVRALPTSRVHAFLLPSRIAESVQECPREVWKPHKPSVAGRTCCDGTGGRTVGVCEDRP